MLWEAESFGHLVPELPKYNTHVVPPSCREHEIPLATKTSSTEDQSPISIKDTYRLLFVTLFRSIISS